MGPVSHSTSVFLNHHDQPEIEHQQKLPGTRASVWIIDGTLAIHATPQQLEELAELLRFAARGEQARRYTLGIERMPVGEEVGPQPGPNAELRNEAVNA